MFPDAMMNVAPGFFCLKLKLLHTFVARFQTLTQKGAGACGRFALFLCPEKEISLFYEP
jgi:hypothetical protein